MQRVTIICEQMYEGNDSVKSAASHESPEMGLEMWRYAIEGAAMSAGFSIHLLNQMIVDWADSLGEKNHESNEFPFTPM